MKELFSKNRVFIIAEAGVNHNGKLSLARKLVDAAKKSGCDAVKFQTFKAENLVAPDARLAGYQKRRGSNGIKNQFDLIKKLELTSDDFRKLKKYCEKKKIIFLSTPFDYESVDLLSKLKVPAFKLGSGEITNLPFLRYVAKKKKAVILSTGMAEIPEIKQAVNAIYDAGNKRLVLLHCVTEYPAPYKEVNLKAMQSLSNMFKIPVGFSDHTEGIEVAIAAVALGAKVIEKHLTLDRSMEGPDHQASLEPQVFQQMVNAIRHVEKSLGDGVKRPMSSEKKYIHLVRKSIITVEDITKGEKISENDIAIKRPGHGIPPEEINKVIGQRARISIKKNQVLKREWVR